MKEIVIDVLDDGEVKIETRGFTGKACIEESKFLKDLLGKEICRQLTPRLLHQQGQRKGGKASPSLRLIEIGEQIVKMAI